MKRGDFIKKITATGLITSISPAAFALGKVSGKSAVTTRTYWLKVLTDLSEPILKNLSEDRLKKEMVFENPGRPESPDYQVLECFARLFSGIAPWLESDGGDEREQLLRNRYRQLVLRCIENGLYAAASDAFNFTKGTQPLVDSSFLSLGLLRAPENILGKLKEDTRHKLVKAIQSTRSIKPYSNNWLLFSAINEVLLYKMGEADWDRMRIDYALKQHEQWYKGDGWYGDGPLFHTDYYNSFVIHPYLVELFRNIPGKEEAEKWNILDWHNMLRPKMMKRATRHSAILEQFIMPDGAFPAIGRSIVYRYGAFHLLSQASLYGFLPENMKPAQAREALTACIRKIHESPGTFKNGWLTLGLSGHQPSLSNIYTSNASAYLYANVLLPLGLMPDAPFWSGEKVLFSSQKTWSGMDVVPDKSMEE